MEHTADTLGNPILRAILEYNHLMMFHALQAGAYLQASAKLSSVITTVTSEVDVQLMCIQAAQSNLEVRRVLGCCYFCVGDKSV